MHIADRSWLMILTLTHMFAVSIHSVLAFCNGPLTISGRVTDVSGNPIGAATITVTTYAAAGWTALGTSNASGYIQILHPPQDVPWYDGLADGASVSAQGFSPLATTVYISSCPYNNSIALARAPPAPSPPDYTPYYLPTAIVVASIIVSIAIATRKKGQS